MKKTLLSISAMLAFAIGANAQIYSANNAAGFATWTFLDVDNDTYNWTAVDLTTGGSALASQGECILSNSWIGPGAGTPLTPNNLAISPLINCSAADGVTLQFGAGSIEATTSGFYEEHYAVYVVTNTAAIIAGTFPTPVYEGTLAAGEVMETQTINITSQAAGQSTVYLVIRHFNCTDENFMIIDDLVVSGQFASVEENNLAVSVYPNPAVDVLNLSFNSQVQHVTIYSLSGQVISTVSVNALTAKVDVSVLAPGVYFYEAVTSEGVRARNTFVKQ